ncbi:DNA replication/repair protein RecF [Methylocystis parvus]|uniref:DNA replication and repair protein RecF n=1 Tax=Methylocystis parvus TaxID=134 RepID=A0A6B8M182_9HYPH|nr:DNA replication/repair protein RecF [Methylocystis parvus]QGM96045.1 DNA replication/repair protein RecF [Methylocystis parvus]WBK00141.1 DNA replication/repair protein RecF [Methylocystis parvus OBBP]
MNPPAPLVRRLILSDYRSYASTRCEFDARLVALSGENGAGKTNVLEALSLFSPGRGLRRAELAECARRDGAGGFAVSLELESDGASTQLGHGLTQEGERQFRIERAPVSSARAFADHLRVLWLTPAMDGLFNGPAGERRRFLDRLALGVDADHGARVNKLERALRNRNRLLEEGVSDKRWLDAAEQEIAALGVAVAAARRETVSRLSALIVAGESVFPWADISIEGEIENMLAEAPALAVEERFRETLSQTRRRDAAAGRTLTGPQTSDLAVRHGPKGEAARDCSTGEQKALLMGLTLAHARLVAKMTVKAPLLLLDEVAAHFDPKRREALFHELEALGGQIWMTGADPFLFASLEGRAEMLHVTPGRIERRG